MTGEHECAEPDPSYLRELSRLRSSPSRRAALSRNQRVVVVSPPQPPQPLRISSAQRCLAAAMLNDRYHIPFVTGLQMLDDIIDTLTPNDRLDIDEALADVECDRLAELEWRGV